MAGEIYLSNLSGQFDYQQILAKYQELKSQQIAIIQQKESKLLQQKSAFRTFADMVNGFNDSFEKVTQSDFVDQKTLKVSNEDVVSATITDTAKLSATTLSFSVDNLAQNDVWLAQNGVAQKSDTVATVDGTLTLTIDGTDYNIDYLATDSLQDIADKINQAADKASATIFFDGTSFRLMLSSSNTGTNNAIVMSDSGDLLDKLNLSNVQAAKDAQIDIYGQKVTSHTNTFENLIDGLSITVKEATATQVDVTVEDDNEAIKNGIEELFAKYNSIVDYTKDVTGENGALSGDYFLQSVRSGIFRQFTPFMEKGLISVDHTNGHVSLNSDKLDELIKNDKEGLKTLLSDLKTTLGNYLQSYVEPTGILDQKEKIYNEKINYLEESIQKTAQRIDKEMENLKKQFIHLDAVLAKLNDVKLRIAAILPQDNKQQ